MMTAATVTQQHAKILRRVFCLSSDLWRACDVVVRGMEDPHLAEARATCAELWTHEFGVGCVTFDTLTDNHIRAIYQMDRADLKTCGMCETALGHGAVHDKSSINAARHWCVQAWNKRFGGAS